MQVVINVCVKVLRVARYRYKLNYALLKQIHSLIRTEQGQTLNQCLGENKSTLALINYRGLFTWGQVHKVYTKGGKYLTELHGERRDGSISLKDKRMINCYCTRRIKSLLFEQVRTRTLDFPWRYCARRIRVETHISLWRHRHGRIGSFECNCITQRSQLNKVREAEW